MLQNGSIYKTLCLFIVQCCRSYNVEGVSFVNNDVAGFTQFLIVFQSLLFTFENRVLLMR